MNIRHKMFFSHLQGLTNPIIRIKTFLNDKKVDNFVFSKKASLLKVIPELEHNKVYSVDVSYKDFDGYYKHDPLQLILFLDENNKICIFEFNASWTSTSSRYLIPIHDVQLFGQSKKKITINEIDKKFYDIHVSSIHPDTIENRKIYDFNKRLCIVSKDTICIHKELDKILSKYKYHIEHVQFKNCEMDEKQRIVHSDVINNISIEIMIEKEKGLYERLSEYFRRQ